MSISKLLDEIDFKIAGLLQQNSALTHSEIAKALNRSQPAIGARIKKLNELGYLTTQIGVDFQKVTELHLMQVDLLTTRSEDIFEMGMFCPFVMNVMKIAGEHNISMFIASADIKCIDHVIDRHFRDKPYVKAIKMTRIVSLGRKLVLPMDLKAEALVEQSADPCKTHPVCTGARLSAGVRSPQELNLV